jgi:hypothetical protein
LPSSFGGEAAATGRGSGWDEFAVEHPVAASASETTKRPAERSRARREEEMEDGNGP